MGNLIRPSQEESQVENSVYKGNTFDENGGTFAGDHLYNSLTYKKVKSSLYEEASDDE